MWAHLTKPSLFITDQEPSHFFFSLKGMFSIKALAFLKKPFAAKETFMLPWFRSYWRAIFLPLLQGERFQWQNRQLSCPWSMQALLPYSTFSQSASIFVNQCSFKLWVQQNKKAFLVNLVGLWRILQVVTFTSYSIKLPSNYKKKVCLAITKICSQSSVRFSRSVMSNSLWPHGLQHTRLPCPSPNPGVCSNSCPLSQWCHPTILSSVVPFSSCLQSFPAPGFGFSQSKTNQSRRRTRSNGQN